MGLLNDILNIASSAISSSSNISSNTLNDAINTKWASPAGFMISKFDRPTVTSTFSDIGYNTPFSSYSFNSITSGLQDLNMLLEKVSITSMDTTPIDIWAGGVWTFTTGRPTTRQLTLTFYDMHNGSTDNSLYKKFLANYWFLYNLYPSEQKWKIRISSNDAYYSSSLKAKTASEKAGNIIVDTSSAILQTVGDLRYSQTDNSLMSFDVIFKFYEAM